VFHEGSQRNALRNICTPPPSHSEPCGTLQLRWAKEAVRSVQQGRGKDQGATRVHGLALKLLHMVDSLEQFAMYSLASAWQTLEQVPPPLVHHTTPLTQPFPTPDLTLPP